MTAYLCVPHVLWMSRERETGERRHTPHTQSTLSLDRSTTRGDTRGEGTARARRKASGGEAARGAGRAQEEEAKGWGQGERDNTRMHGMRLHDSSKGQSHSAHATPHRRQNHSHAPCVSTGQLTRALSAHYAHPHRRETIRKCTVCEYRTA